jgi:hypothetical protein
MPQIGPQMTEPPRHYSPGEMQQRLAELLAMGVRLYGVELSSHEKEALATLIGTFFRWKREYLDKKD